MKSVITAITLAGTATLTSAAWAQDVASFYKGKTVNVLVGVSAGGEYDLHARLAARHIGKHIPGNPRVIVQNMTGAGGVVMANYLYNVAAKDGTYLGGIQNGFPALQAIGTRQLKFDTGKFQFIGAITPTVETMVLWHTAGAKSVADATKKEIAIGAVSKGSITYAYPMLLNAFAGTKFKVSVGYRGGNGVNLAMERGEVFGRNNTWSSWKATRSAWLKENKIVIISYAGPKPKDLPDVPSLVSYAKTDDDKKLIELITSGAEFGRPLVAPPGVPADRIAALRKAYADTMKDAEFLADAKKARVDVDPIDPMHMEKVVKNVLATPENVRMKARNFIQ